MSLFFLIGMPGAGKTYWAQKLAAYYQVPFIDLDQYIEQQEQLSITDFFLKYGEEAFRKKENKTLGNIIKGHTQTTIIACGGGTPCFFNNMELMKRAGTTIYLQVRLGTLSQRLQGAIYSRPLLQQQEDLPVYLERQLQVRKYIYEQADFILHTENISVTTFDKIFYPCTDRQ